MAEDEEWQRIRSRFISDFGHYVEIYGGREIMGWIMGLLTFTLEPMPLPEMARALKVSKAAVSINIRSLRQVGLVEKVSFPGDRRDFYQLHRDFERGMLAGVLKKVEDLALILEKTHDALKDRPPDAAGEAVGRRLLAQREAFAQFISLANDLDRRWIGKGPPWSRRDPTLAIRPDKRLPDSPGP